jgi:hypothetical protein
MGLVIQYFNALKLWQWLLDILNAILNLPDLIGEVITDLFVPTVPIGDHFVPLQDNVKEKFNTPDDFRFLVPSGGGDACPPNIMYKGMVIVDTSFACDAAKWFKPIMTGFMYFLFGWWLFRKTNALMAKRGGAL